jgi:hypothetical protein
LNFDSQSQKIVKGLKIPLCYVCYKLVAVILWVEAQVTSHVAAAGPVEVSAMFAVFAVGFDYIVVLQSVAVVREVVQGAG